MTELERSFLDDEYQSNQYIQKRERIKNPSITLTYKETIPLINKIFNITLRNTYIRNT